MNVQWTLRERRHEVELAVALLVAGQDLARARSARQMDQAVLLNLRLWRAIRARAATLEDGESLADCADHVATMLALQAAPYPDPRDLAYVAGRNLALAEDLVGAAALNHGRDQLTAEWAGQGRAHAFGPWLLRRLEPVDAFA